MRNTFLTFVVTLVAALPPLALGSSFGRPTVIYASVGLSPGVESDVPGGGGLKFASFDRPVRSPDGSQWMLLARNTQAAATDAMYLTGTGVTGLLRIHEGVTVIESPGVNRFAENMSDRRVGIAADGRYAFTVNLTVATTDDQVIVKGAAGPALSLAIAGREGGPIGAALPGILYGSGISDVNLTNGGAVAVRATSLPGTTPADANSALFMGDGATLAAQRRTLATRPTGQLGAEDWEALDFGSFWVDAAGANWLVRGSLTGDPNSNAVTAVNNQVVIQERVTDFTGDSPVSATLAANMVSNGDWYARGENLNDRPWVVRNGQRLFTSGDPVPGGLAGETFSSAVWNVTGGNTFFVHTGNNVGDHVVSGFTSADPNFNAVWILNRANKVVLRRGDAVDVDADGVFNDNAFIDLTGLSGASLNNKVDSAFLTDDGWLYFTADIRVPPRGIAAAEALLRMRIKCGPADLNADGVVSQDDMDILLFSFDLDAGGDVTGDGRTDQDDLDLLLFDFESSCL